MYRKKLKLKLFQALDGARHGRVASQKSDMNWEEISIVRGNGESLSGSRSRNFDHLFDETGFNLREEFLKRF
jgi:hypothetical protein